MDQRLPYWGKAVWHHGPVRPPRGRRLGSIGGVPIYGRLSALVLPALYLPWYPACAIRLGDDQGKRRGEEHPQGHTP